MCAGRLDMGDRFTEPLETRLKFQVGVARTQMFVSFVDRCRIRDLKVQTEIPALFFFFFFAHVLLSSVCTSRGYRCRPFSPPVLAFNFYRA